MISQRIHYIIQIIVSELHQNVLRKLVLKLTKDLTKWQEKRIIDMHRADIRAELEKKGTSLAQLGIENGLSRTTVRNALDKPYPKGEWIIANALGLKPSDIWPSRYRE